MTTPARSSSPDPTNLQPHADPVAIRTGFDPAHLQSGLNAIVSAGVPGAIAEVIDGEESWTAGSGLADVESGLQMRPELHHRVGSIAKTFTTVAVLQLAEAGLLDLDVPVSRHLPELAADGGDPAGAEVTVRMLMNHTSGFAEYLPVIYESLRPFPDIASTSPQSLFDHRHTHFNRHELIAAGLASPPVGAPGGEPGVYSNTNYLLLAELIECLTGTGAEDHISSAVIAPAGLGDTYYPRAKRLEAVHSKLYESWFDMIDPPADFSEFDMSWVGPAASLVSTAADLNRFFGLLVSGGILTSESLTQMQRTGPVISFEGIPIDYGLGLHRQEHPRRPDDERMIRGGDEVFWGHDGTVWGGGALTVVSDDGRRRMTLLLNRQRWNTLDETGQPKPHAIDAAVAEFIGLGLGG